MVEALLFLKENSDLWSIKDVREALRRVKENEKMKRAEEKLQELHAQEATSQPRPMYWGFSKCILL